MKDLWSHNRNPTNLSLYFSVVQEPKMIPYLEECFSSLGQPCRVYGQLRGDRNPNNLFLYLSFSEELRVVRVFPICNVICLAFMDCKMAYVLKAYN